MTLLDEDFEDDEYYPPLILDIGTGFSKAGYSDQDLSRLRLCPTVVGRPKQYGIMVGMGQRDHWVGDEALNKRYVLIKSFHNFFYTYIEL